MQRIKICSSLILNAFLTASITHEPLFRGLFTTTRDTQLIFDNFNTTVILNQLPAIVLVYP